MKRILFICALALLFCPYYCLPIEAARLQLGKSLLLQEKDIELDASNGSREDTSEYTYPRRSLGSSFVSDWLDKPGYGLNFLYQFGQIYTSTLSGEIMEVKQAAIADGRQDWVDQVKFIYNIDFQSTDTRSHRPPYDWEIPLIRHTPHKAINFAVYFNQILGVDWIFRDKDGVAIETWGYEVALNSTPACPKGRWDGYLINEAGEYILDEYGQRINLGVGSTVGLSVYEWLAGPFTENVIQNSLFKEAYDGLQTEDLPTAWLYTFQGQVPDPLRNGVGMTVDQLTAYAGATWATFFTDFFGPLKEQFITRINGHGLRYHLEGWPQNPWPHYQQTITGCKLEDYGKWGGWPHYDLPMWMEVYTAIEELYHPLSGERPLSEYDSREGWDVTDIQSLPNYSSSQEEIKRFSRMSLSATLMGDGYWDSSWEEDYYHNLFLRGGQSQYAPRYIAEASVKLGKALGGYAIYTEPQHLLKPVYYRQFYNEEADKLYTVAHNPWDIEINGIPKKDGVWFYGNWPNGEYSRVMGGGMQNQPPVLASIGNKDISEGSLLEFTVRASDLNMGDRLTLTVSNLPQGASFVDQGNGTGIFSWAPEFDQAGVHPGIRFQVSDGQATDFEDIMVTVTNVNRPPVFNVIGDKQVSENQLLQFIVDASDPDGDELYYSVVNLPNGAAFDPGTHIFTWTPGFEQSGDHSNIRFSVTDGIDNDAEDILITVMNTNREPVLAPIGSKEVKTGDLLQFVISAADPDGTIVNFSASSLPAGATLVDNHNNTATFSWRPLYNQAGNYNVQFKASDEESFDAETIQIKVKPKYHKGIL